jgi:MFS family permease
MAEVKAKPSLAEMGRAFRHPNYRLFFAGQLVSLIGTWMQTAAQSWLVYRLSGSAELLGLAGFFSQGPVFFFAQIGGAVADRRNRHGILVATQIASMLLALVLAGLTLGGVVQVWQVFLLAALLGTVNAFDIPTRQAFLVEMVGHDDMQNAIALNSSMFNAARLVGPAVAGVTVAAVGEGWCFLINGLSYVAVIASLLAMRMAPFLPSRVKGSILAEMREGLSYSTRTRPIRAVLLLIGVMSLLGMPYTVLMPIFAAQILGGGAEHLGLLMSSAGLGALLGALLLARRSGLGGIGKTIGLAIAGFGGALILFAFSHWFWLSALLLVLVGFCQMTQMASSNTLVQAMVPDSYRGRVMALYSMMFMGLAPFGALLSGLVAGFIGAPATIALGGLACILGGAVFARALPKLHEEIRALVAAKGGVEGKDAFDDQRALSERPRARTRPPGEGPR